MPNFIKRERMGWTNPFLVVADAEGIVDELTFADIDNATNRAAWFLSQNLAQDEDKFYYMGRLDLRYYIWLFAAMKAGKCVSALPRPRTVSGRRWADDILRLCYPLRAIQSMRICCCSRTSAPKRYSTAAKTSKSWSLFTQPQKTL